MISKIRKWFSRFLEVYAKESLLKEIDTLERKTEKQAQVINEQASYISGLKESLRAIKRVTIHNEVK